MLIRAHDARLSARAERGERAWGGPPPPPRRNSGHARSAASLSSFSLLSLGFRVRKVGSKKLCGNACLPLPASHASISGISLLPFFPSSLNTRLPPPSFDHRVCVGRFEWAQVVPTVVGSSARRCLMRFSPSRVALPALARPQPLSGRLSPPDSHLSPRPEPDSCMVLSHCPTL